MKIYAIALFLILLVLFTSGCTSSNIQSGQNPVGESSLISEKPTQDYEIVIYNVTKTINTNFCNGTSGLTRMQNPCEDYNFVIIDISIRNNKKCNYTSVNECPIISYHDFMLIDNTYQHTRESILSTGRYFYKEQRDDFVKAGVMPESAFPESVLLPASGEIVRGYLVFQIDKDEVNTFMNSAKLIAKKPQKYVNYRERDKGENIFEIPDIYKIDYSKFKPLVSFSKPSSEVNISVNSITKIDDSNDPRFNPGISWSNEPSPKPRIDTSTLGVLANSNNYEYVILDITIANNKNSPLDLRNVSFSVKDADNHYYLRDTSYDDFGGPGSDLIMPHRLNRNVKLQPGETIRGDISFFINKRTAPYELWIRGLSEYYSTPITGL